MRCCDSPKPLNVTYAPVVVYTFCGLFIYFLFGCTVPGYPGGLLAVLVDVPFIYLNLSICIIYLFFVLFVSFREDFIVGLLN